MLDRRTVLLRAGVGPKIVDSCCDLLAKKFLCSVGFIQIGVENVELPGLLLFDAAFMHSVLRCDLP